MITNVKIGDTTENSASQYNALTSIQDEWDIGTLMLPFSTNPNAYQPFSLVDITMEDSTHEYWWLDSDTKEDVDKQNKEFFEHKIQLIELGKILERFPMTNRALVQLTSGTQITATDAINNIIATVPFRTIDEVSSGAVIDSIDPILKAKADKVIIPDNYLTGRTMKETFVQILKLPGINGFPRLIRDIDGNFILGADYYNELRNLVDKDAKSLFNQQTQNSTKYAKAINISASNLIYSFNKNTSFVIDPSPTGWIPIRSDTNLMSVDDAFGELGDEIEILIKAEADILFFAQDTPLDRQTFDITKYVLDSETRADKDPLVSVTGTTVEVGQNNSIQYKIGDNRITALYETDQFNNVEVIGSLYTSVLLDAGFALPEVTLDAPNELRIRISYVAKIDATLEIERTDLSDVSNNSILISGQSDTFLASDRVIDEAISTVDRLGSVDFNTKEIVSSLSAIHVVGDYTNDGLVLTDVERVALPDHYEVLYHWVKNFQKRSDFLGLNSEPRIYEVGTQLKRLEKYTQYIIADTVSKPNTSFVNLFGVRVFANTITTNNSNSFDKPIYAVTYQSTSIPLQILQDDALRLTVVPGAGKSLMYFPFGFKNFKNAGKQLVQEGVSFYNQNVNYTDDDGRAVDFQVKYVNDLVSDRNLLPVVDDPITDVHIDTGFFRLNKNQTEILSFNYQLGVYPSQARVSDFIIGDYLTKNNNLINKRNGVYDDLFIWISGERYNLSENRFAKGTNIGQVYNANVDDPLFIELDNPIGTSNQPVNWALADADGNLYLAVNQMSYNMQFVDGEWIGDFENINEVYFNFVGERY